MKPTAMKPTAMKPTAQAWLPGDTPVPPALERRLAECVAEWSGRWFVADPLVVGPLARGAALDLAWHALGDGMMLGLAPTAAVAIGARILGIAVGERGAADQSLLDEVAEACLIDLRQTLAGTFAASRDAAWHPVAGPGERVAVIGSPLRPLLAIALTSERFAALARASLPRTTPPSLGAGHAALARTAVTVGAALGRCTISLAELQALGTGDVLVLDTPVDAAVPLAVDGVPLPRGRCVVVGANGVSALEILQPVQ